MSEIESQMPYGRKMIIEKRLDFLAARISESISTELPWLRIEKAGSSDKPINPTLLWCTAGNVADIRSAAQVLL
jgi:hypothetical protein